MKLSESRRADLLKQVFPEDADLIGPKNLKKICRDNRPEVAQTQFGSNVSFSDIIIMFFQSLSYVDTVLNVYNHLKNEEPEPAPQKVIQITINNYNLDTSRIPKKKLFELAALAIQQAEEHE